MKDQIQITDEAERDLFGISHYISANLKEPQVALNQIRRINEAILSLEEFPYRHELVSGTLLSTLNYRKMKVDNYAIFYRVDEEARTVMINYILYGRRDFSSI
jgi:addiction module RelE/StbE family toxin